MSLKVIKVSQDFFSLYEPVCACPFTSEDCPGIINDFQRGIPPRGFYTLGTPQSVKILIVAKNPGHLLQDERKIYLNQTPRQITKIQFRLIHQVFQNCNTILLSKNRSMTFHRNLLRYFSYFLNIPAEEVFFHCAYTNLVKCQTVGEQDRLDKITMSNCFERHLCRELEYFKPKVLVALGQEVFQALSKSSLGLPIVRLKHPSYYYAKEKEEKILKDLKSKIRETIGFI